MYYFSLFGEYVRMAFNALRVHKLRSSLTTLGIFIGVTTIITIFTTIQGLNEYVMGELSNIGSASVYVQKYPWVIEGDFWRYRNRKNVTYKEYESLVRYSREADYISPQVFSRKNVKYKNEQYEGIFVLGTNEQYKDTDNIIPERGRFLTELDVRSKIPVCVIGPELADNLFKEEEPLGKRIKIGDRKYRVIGILERRGKVFGQSWDSFVIVPIGAFRRVYGGHRGLRIAMAVKNVDRLENMKDDIRGVMRKIRKIAPGEDDDFAINQQDMLTDLYRQLTGTLFAIVFVIGGISLLVGGIGIMNIMMVSVTERTKEIGIRKAIGAKRKNILSQFLMESIAIASVGGLLGIILGYLGGSMVLSQMSLSTGVSLTSIMIGFGFSSIVGVSAGFYPAWKAAKMNPIDALHFD